MTTPAFRPAPDPDVTVRLDPAAEAREHGVPLDEVGPPADVASWALHWCARLTFSDDMFFHDGRGLHYTLHTGFDFPVGGFVTKTITAAQLRTFGESLIALADRAGARRPAGAPHLGGAA
jgi:hypothetical protein